jgi:hypothetical protein
MARDVPAMTEAPSDVRGVVMNGTGGVWTVRTTTGAQHQATMRGRLKQEGADKIAVGDDVRLEEEDRGGSWVIAELYPRRSRLARRAPGGAHGERVVVANIDQVIVVFAFAKPEPHPRMLDRFLVIAAANDIQARIVMNQLHEREGAHRARRARRGAARAHIGPERPIGRREVVAPQLDLPRARLPRGRDQRVGEQGAPHDGGCGNASAPGRRLRGRHAGAP